MNHKKPIDLSQAHLIPISIKKYALNIWETMQQYRAVNPVKQRLHLLLSKANSILAEKAMTSKYFANTREVPNKLNGLKALVDNESDWLKKRRGEFKGERYAAPEDMVLKHHDFPYSFFLVYYFDNDLSSPIGALRELVGPEVDKLPADFDFSFDEIFGKSSIQCTSQGKVQNRFFRFDNSWEWADRTSLNKLFAPFNHDLLQDYVDRSVRPVFIVESFQAANQLETEIKQGNIQYLWTELQRVLSSSSADNNTPLLFYIERNYQGLQIHNFDSPQRWPLTNGDCTAIFSRMIADTSCEPLPASGDAVVTAAVGGYSIPEYTDWKLMNDRDIYIFKFGERRPEKFLSELLDVTACIVRDTDESIVSRIKYIIMSEKCGIEVKNNDIKYWTLSELFAEAQLYDCPIPQTLASLFDLYLRKDSQGKANPYVIEPFLRRNSWMLLSGEEGTGKSYMAMALSAALATGGKLFFNWKIRQHKSTVLYIADSEMTDDIIRDRLTVFKHLYKGCTENLIVQSVKNLNILDGGMKYIEERLIQESLENRSVEILVLDHLLKLTNAHGDEEEHWPKIRQWIEELNERGITVILLHHEYAGSRMLGSRLLAADAPSRLHLAVVEQSGDDKIINFGVRIVKNRGGVLQREISPISLKIDKSPAWVSPEDAETDNNATNFRQISQEERINQVTELRKTMSVREIAAKLGCSKSSIEKIIQKLPDDLKKTTKM